MFKFAPDKKVINCDCPPMKKDTDGVKRYYICNCGMKEWAEQIKKQS